MKRLAIFALVFLSALRFPQSGFAESPPESFLHPRPAAAFPFAFWKADAAGATPTPSASPSASPNTFVATYSSDGDTNGILTFAGKNFDAGGSWTNPHTAGYVVAVRSSDETGTATHIVNHAVENTHTSNVANSWIAIDLGSPRSAVLDKYSIRIRSGADPRAIRNWKLQGTNSTASNSISHLAAATWTDIDVRVADTTMANTGSTWVTYTITGTPGGYRWIRILQNGLNGGAVPDNYFTVSEIELYGTLSY